MGASSFRTSFRRRAAAGSDKGAATLESRAETQVAFALGGILHFPADFVLKPLMSEVAQADWNTSHALMQNSVANTATEQNTVSIREVSAYWRGERADPPDIKQGGIWRPKPRKT